MLKPSNERIFCVAPSIKSYFVNLPFTCSPFSYQTFILLQLTDASEEIPHYVTAKATYWRQMLPVFCSASALPENFHYTSIAGDRHNNGRFVQWCSNVYQRNPDRTAGQDQLSDSWMENSDVAWYASKYILVSLVQVRCCSCWRLLSTGGPTLTYFVTLGEMSFPIKLRRCTRLKSQESHMSADFCNSVCFSYAQVSVVS